MTSTAIRPIALGVILRDNHILCFKHRNESGIFYRPIGGGIEHGEKAAAALIREFEEEMGAKVRPIRRIGVLENIFTWQGRVNHELAFMFEAEFVNRDLYLNDRMKITEGDLILWSEWVALDQIFRGEVTIYPNGIGDLLGQEYTNLKKFAYNIEKP
ncbi:MAG: NUDIX domain-containing protein [Bacteroidota bacterium]